MKRINRLFCALVCLVLVFLSACSVAEGIMQAVNPETATPTSTATPTATATPVPTATLTPTPTPGVGSMLINEKDGAALMYVPEGAFMGLSKKVRTALEFFKEA